MRKHAVLSLVVVIPVLLQAQMVYRLEPLSRANSIDLTIANSTGQDAEMVGVHVRRHPQYITFVKREHTLNVIGSGKDAVVTFVFDVGRPVAVAGLDTLEVHITDRSGVLARKEILVSVAAPLEFGLAQNYPNPFNPLTTIDYQLPAASRVIMKVYDVLGREVETLIDERQEAGYKTVQLNADRVASGVYFYRLTAQPVTGGATFSQVKKLMVMR